LAVCSFPTRRSSELVRTVSMDADAYEAWVDFADPDTGESRGTVRKNSVRFLEKNINVDKTLSLAALDSDAIAVQLREAMREAAQDRKSTRLNSSHVS